MKVLGIYSDKIRFFASIHSIDIIAHIAEGVECVMVLLHCDHEE